MKESLLLDGVSYGLNDTIAISSTRTLTVKGLGGALIQGGNSPTYGVTESLSQVNEGGSVNFTVNTDHVGAGTTLYFNTTGASVDAADFSDNTLTGNFNIVGVANTTVGVATFTRTLSNDFNTEGETFTMEIRTNSVSGPVVATSGIITVIDVSPSLTVTPSTTTINEGSTVIMTVSGANIPNGSYYYTIKEEEGSVTPADFGGNINFTGSFSVTNGTGAFSLGIAQDRETEGIDRFLVEIRKDSITGTILATSSVITIGDISRAVGSEASGLTFGPVQVNRDNGVATEASDWYTICDLDNVPDGSSIALFIDNSGSMRTQYVQASYDLLIEKLNARGITITTVTNAFEDWITPFLVNLP